MARPDPAFFLFAAPYRAIQSLGPDPALPTRRKDRRGSALIWRLSTPPLPAELEFARDRPPGIALVVILPPAEAIDRPDHVLQVTEVCRPHSILPHHRRPNIVDLRSVLSRPPDDLAGEVADYLTWRGLTLDLDTRRLIRKTLELSAELTTVKGLARGLYLSRRALGRRFTRRGLPVPSHWLHFGRVLRACARLQDTQETLFAAATTLSYPDGFALSNQMVRLVGVRPTLARERLGWEWILEEWLLREARSGGFSRDRSRVLLADHKRPPPLSPSAPGDPPSTQGIGRRGEVKIRAEGSKPATEDGGADG